MSWRFLANYHINVSLGEESSRPRMNSAEVPAVWALCSTLRQAHRRCYLDRSIVRPRKEAVTQATAALSRRSMFAGH